MLRLKLLPWATESYYTVLLGARHTVAAIVVQSEQEAHRGWLYRVEVNHDDGTQTHHDVTLAWVDHEHWCGGRLAPSLVIEAVVAYVMAHRGEPALPPRFDAARARRWLPEIDEKLKSAL